MKYLQPWKYVQLKKRLNFVLLYINDCYTETVNSATIHWPKSYLGLQILQQVQLLKLHAERLVSFSGKQTA